VQKRAGRVLTCEKVGYRERFPRALFRMPFQYERDDTRKRITVRVSGSFAIADLFGIVDRHFAEKVWGYAMLYDLTSLIGAPSVADVARISDYVQRHVDQRPRGPVAVVTPQPATFGMVRMYALMNDGKVTLGAFHTVEAAERWLDQRHAEP